MISRSLIVAGFIHISETDKIKNKQKKRPTHVDRFLLFIA